MDQDRLAALSAHRQPDTSEPPIIEVQRVPAPQPTNGAANSLHLPSFQDTSSISAFYAETASIQESIIQFDANVTTIADLHARSWSALFKRDAAANRLRLAELTESTCALTNALSKRIKALKVKPGDASAQAEIRRNRITLVHRKFVETLQRYQNVEKQYQQRYRDRVEWQFRIVKPDATPEELSAFVNDTEDSGNANFLQDTASSTRCGESRKVYREVQERQDIQRIEVTLAELAQLFNDMAVLIAEQDEQIITIETKANGVKEDARKGVDEVDVAIEHAPTTRQSWIRCFIVTVMLLAPTGIFLGVYFSQVSAMEKPLPSHL